MNTKVFGFTGTAVGEIGTIVDNTLKEDTYTIKENTEIKALKINKKENYILKQISLFIKRCIDIIGSLFGIVLMVPLILIIKIISIKNSNDRGPLFYSQKRIGKDGKYFQMYKFRTMCVDADKKLEDLLARDEEARKEYTKYKKLKNDPRVTKIGKILRKTSLDEIPQFINVFLGQMSFVGPRPYLPREKEEMGDYYNVITETKPGITGLWQTSGRSNTTFDERLDMDVTYYKDCSLKTDFKILIKTILNVVKKEGAV